MKTASPWKLNTGRYSTVLTDGHFDVAVVGGGITGLTAAFLLKQSGKRVCVLERDRLGSGDTGMTTAHLTYQTDLRISELVSTFGEAAAVLALRGGEAAINLIESNVTQRGIQCAFRRVPGYLHAAWQGNEDEAEQLAAEADQLASWGFAARFLNEVPYCHRPGIGFADQAKFDPLKYLAALASLVDGDGSAVYEQSEVSEIQDHPLKLTVGKRQLEVDHVVIATHVPLMGATGLLKATLLQTKLFPYSSYAIGAKLAKGVLPEACFWDTSDPYYYLRVDAGKTHDYVIFGGVDHKTGQEPDTEHRFDGLQATLGEILPEAQPDRRWSGQVIETNDGLPYIGETAPRQFVATGYSGNGMTFGTLAGMMVCDAIMERPNPWQDLLAVERKKLRGGTWDYLVENIDFPYYYLKDRLVGERVEAVSDVQPGEGKILKLDGQRVACSRDQAGKVTTVSAYCTHMGCLVRWNGAERTWDCPCHGSRFTSDGQVIGGPAELPLEPVVERESAGK